jgi:hypothetical protein
MLHFFHAQQKYKKNELKEQNAPDIRTKKSQRRTAGTVHAINRSPVSPCFHGGEISAVTV